MHTAGNKAACRECHSTRVKRGQTVAGAQSLRLLEADFSRNVDVKQVNLGGNGSRLDAVGVKISLAGKSPRTFLCFRIISPSGPNTAQVLYSFPPSSSGMDPVEHENTKNMTKKSCNLVFKY